jgi:hypothetical protein
MGTGNVFNGLSEQSKYDTLKWWDCAITTAMDPLFGYNKENKFGGYTSTKTIGR